MCGAQCGICSSISKKSGGVKKAQTSINTAFFQEVDHKNRGMDWQAYCTRRVNIENIQKKE